MLNATCDIGETGHIKAVAALFGCFTVTQPQLVAQPLSEGYFYRDARLRSRSTLRMAYSYRLLQSSYVYRTF